ncbi:protein kinase, partial [Candidatus Pacearchaeota archaeon]|nr:protein kinase [Candidatus Pacearchaeota archaeon]
MNLIDRVRRNGFGEVEKPVELSLEDVKKLEENGYKVIKNLGEGHTRSAHLCLYEDSRVKQLRVLTFPKSELDLESITTAINTSGGTRDVDLQEVEIINNIPPHQNIVDVVHSFDLNGRVINAMPYYEGAKDLEQYVKDRSSKEIPVRDFFDVGSQIIEGALHLEKCGFLHRDLKPNNVLVVSRYSSEGSVRNVKLADFQLATDTSSIQKKYLPTMGSGSYQKPYLQNSLLKDYLGYATSETEVFSLGGVLYYLLTGKHAFNRRIVQDDEGREI